MRQYTPVVYLLCAGSVVSNKMAVVDGWEGATELLFLPLAVPCYLISDTKNGVDIRAPCWDM